MIAQSCALCGDESFAQIWLHNEMLQVEGKKMSKSLGNFFTVRDLLDQGYPGEVIRFVLLSTHYGKPMDWTARKAEEAFRTLKKWSSLIDSTPTTFDSSLRVPDAFVDVLSNDLNTPGAIAYLHNLAKVGSSDAVSDLIACGQLLGFDLRHMDHLRLREALLSEELLGLALLNDDDVALRIEELIALRASARAAKDFARADAIRAAFAAAGVTVKDTADGAVWELSPGFDPAKLEAVR